MPVRIPASVHRATGATGALHAGRRNAHRIPGASHTRRRRHASNHAARRLDPFLRRSGERGRGRREHRPGARPGGAGDQGGRRPARPRRHDRGRRLRRRRHEGFRGGAGIAAPRRGPRPRRGGEGALPGDADHHRAGHRERLLLRLRARAALHPGGSGADRGPDARDRRSRRADHPRGLGPRRGDPLLPRLGRGVQGRDHRGDPGGRARLPVPPGRVDRSLPRPAPPLHRQARQGVQADAHLGRVLARRSRQRDAPAGLRHRVGEREAARGIPPHAGGGRAARPPPARPRDGPLPLPGGIAGLGVLASEGPAALPHAHRLRPRTPERGRLRRGGHPGAHGPQPVGSLRALGGVPREHVHLPDRGRPGLRPEADELPGPRGRSSRTAR